MPNDELFFIPKGVSTRWASPENVWGQPGGGGRAACGRKGSPYFFIFPGQTIPLAEVVGSSGVIRRIWMTFHDLSPRMLKQLRLEFFWDSATKPAVSVPLGDFFCMGLGRMAAFESAFFSSPEGRSFNCFIPMPFQTGMRVTVTNDGRGVAGMFFYDIDYTLGDDIPPGTPYFHAWYNQQLPTGMRVDYTVLEQVRGRGRYLGASFGVVMDKARYGQSWGGEGEVKFFIDDDDDQPTLCGTGTEDYIGTGWCQGVFSHQYQGCTVADDDKMHLCFYRFHGPDPIYFQNGLRAAIQQIGSWNPALLDFFRRNNITIWRAGAAAQEPAEPVDLNDPWLPPFDLFEREDNWSSCCYFYLDSPTNDLPVLPELRERARSIPDFAVEELDNVPDVNPQVTMLKQYIPRLEALTLEELQGLRAALDAVVRVLSHQQQALRRDEEPPC